MSFTSLEFVYLRLFERTRAGVLPDEAMVSLEDALLADPKAGAVIAGTGGVRKIRTATAGGGKRGGTRVIYLYVPVHQTIYFLMAYAKNVQENLTPEQKEAVRRIAEQLRGEPWPRRREHGG